MCFSTKPKVWKGGVAAGIAGDRLQGHHPLSAYRKMVHIGDEIVAFLFHEVVELVQKVLCELPIRPEFIVLSASRGHNMLIINSITHVVVDEHIRVCEVIDLLERSWHCRESL